MASLLERWKQRKLVQWALAYLAGVFVVLQVMDAVAEGLGLSAGGQRVVLIILAAGLPVALVAAWYHGEKGRQQVSGAELLIVTGIMGLAGLLLFALSPGFEAENRAEAGEGPATAIRASRNAPSIAVLPFENISPDPNDAYFAEGIHHEVLTQLAKISALDVISRTSVLTFAESSARIPQIASELGATAIATGSVRIAGDRVRITIELIDPSTDSQLWAEEFDRKFTTENLFDIQSAVARQFAGAVRAEITGAETARLASRPTENLEAYRHYLRGSTHRARPHVAGEIDLAIAEYEQAVELDPLFAEGWAALTDAYVFACCWAGRPEFRPKATAALARAEEIAPELGLTRYAKGSYYSRAETNLDRAGTELEAAHRLLPSNVNVLQELGNVRRRQNRIEESIDVYRRALELDPVGSSLSHMNLGFSLMSLRRFDEADEAFATASATSTTAFQRPAAEAFRILLRLGQGDIGGAAEFDEALPSEVRALLPGTLYEAFPSIDANYYRREYALAIDRQRGHDETIRLLGLMAFLDGRSALADSVATELETEWRSRLTPSSHPRLVSLVYAKLAVARALKNDRQRARIFADSMEATLPLEDDPVYAARWRYLGAEALVMVGDHERALDMLEAFASVQQSVPPSIVAIDPMFEPLHDHARFKTLLNQLAH